MNQSVKLKMYIVIRPDVSTAVALVAAAHASLGTYLTYESDSLMQEWKNTSFIKILLKPLNLEHFHNCKKFGEHRVFTESSLDNLEVAIGYKIIRNPSQFIKDIPLWTEK
jgi:peptidyl-tRNA hydrolase